MPNTRFTTLIEFLIIVGLLGAVFFVDLPQTAFHADENMWINQSSHLEDFFNGNFAAFGERKYYALTMPTITEYVVGVSRRAGGYSPKRLPEIWDWEKTYDENKAARRIPTPRLLWWSRLLPALLGMTAILVTFYLLKDAFHARIGYLWLVLTITNAWLITALQRAMGEAPLLFFIVIAMLTASLAVRAFNRQAMRASLFWIVLFGIFTGLAGQTKSNGLGMLGLGLIILLWLTVRCSPIQRWRFLTMGLTGLMLATFVAFVGTNPFLWSNPIAKTVQTFQYRIEVMNGIQAQSFPKIVIHGWNEAVQIFVTQTFKNLASIKFPNSEYLLMILTGFGLILLFSQTWSTLTGKQVNPSALSIFLMGLFMSIPSLFTPLNIDRYYFLPVYFVSILIVVGFDWFLQYIIDIRSSVGEPTPQTKPEA